MAYTCKTCGAISDSPGHLCNPCDDKQVCSFCGTPDTDATHMCKSKLEKMKYVCGGCGRLAMNEKHLCQPSLVA